MNKKLTPKDLASAAFGIISAALCFYSGAKTILRVVNDVKSKKRKHENV